MKKSKRSSLTELTPMSSLETRPSIKTDKSTPTTFSENFCFEAKTTAITQARKLTNINMAQNKIEDFMKSI